MLNNFGASALRADTVPAVVTTLQSLIGCFDLDPNRVFDLVLDRRVGVSLHTDDHALRRSFWFRARTVLGGDDQSQHSSF